MAVVILKTEGKFLMMILMKNQLINPKIKSPVKSDLGLVFLIHQLKGAKETLEICWLICLLRRRKRYKLGRKTKLVSSLQNK
jgi:hypothetical protein